MAGQNVKGKILEHVRGKILKKKIRLRQNKKNGFCFVPEVGIEPFLSILLS